MFNSLLDNLNTYIIASGGNELLLPPNFKENHSLNRETVIRSWLWKVPGFRRWRVTRMDAGQKLQVLNSVAYPEFDNDMPIMGIDLLWFGLKERLVAILDFQPLTQDEKYFERYYEELKALKSSFYEFSNTRNMNSYDINKYFSPWVLFCRGGLVQMENSLPLIFNRFLNSYLNLHQKSLTINSKISPDEVKKLHISYDTYNLEKDPAHGLFKSYFGEQWADSFLNEFLFPRIP